MADKNAPHSFDFDLSPTATPRLDHCASRQLLSGQTRPMEETAQRSRWRSPVLPGDPNLDPFYLERALKRESDVLDRENLLQTVWEDGELLVDPTLKEIRERAEV